MLAPKEGCKTNFQMQIPGSKNIIILSFFCLKAIHFHIRNIELQYLCSATKNWTDTAADKKVCKFIVEDVTSRSTELNNWIQ